MGAGISGLGIAAIVCIVVLVFTCIVRYLLENSLRKDKMKSDQQSHHIVPIESALDPTSNSRKDFDNAELYSKFAPSITSEKDQAEAQYLAEDHRVNTNMAHVEEASAHLGGVLERLGSTRNLVVVQDDHLDNERRFSMT